MYIEVDIDQINHFGRKKKLNYRLHVRGVPVRLNIYTQKMLNLEGVDIFSHY